MASYLSHRNFSNPFHRGVLVRGDTVANSLKKCTKVDPALQEELQKIVEALSAAGKGILAIDETSSSLDAKFAEIDLENTEIARGDCRRMLLSADKSLLSKYISGVILNHETLHQKTTEDKDFLDLLEEINLLAGVKVDKGTIRLFGTRDEDTTEGLDNLEERCIAYKRDGCHFAKWRCTYKMADDRPSPLAIEENARILARYAAIAQSARLVPIVEPEILTTGEQQMPRALEVHEEVISVLFRAMIRHHVFLEGIILKPAMIVAGIENGKFGKPRSEVVADFTLTALRRTVPSAVPSIMFLSGGQSDEDAVLNLDAINRAEGKKPWNLSFCYGRALHNAAITAWKGNPENNAIAQSIFLERAKRCSDASRGILQVEDFEKSSDPPNDSDEQ